MWLEEVKSELLCVVHEANCYEKEIQGADVAEFHCDNNITCSCKKSPLKESRMLLYLPT